MKWDTDYMVNGHHIDIVTSDNHGHKLIMILCDSNEVAEYSYNPEFIIGAKTILALIQRIASDA